MAFAADLIKGKIKPKRRRSNQPSRIENELIAQFVFYLQAIHPAWQKRKVIEKIAEMIGVEWRHVCWRSSIQTALSSARRAHAPRRYV
jgi:hypothetical protein